MNSERCRWCSGLSGSIFIHTTIGLATTLDPIGGALLPQWAEEVHRVDTSAGAKQIETSASTTEPAPVSVDHGLSPIAGQ